MMKPGKVFIAALLGLLVGFSACKKDKQPGATSTFTLQIKAKYGNQIFTLNSPYTDTTGRVMVFTLFDFYLSHINLISTNGTLVSVAPTALISLEDSLSTITASNIQGSFTGISFSCGLDSLTNDTTNPNNYLPPNPLAGAYGMYWPMIKYEFELMEGKWDTAQISVMRNPIVYHIGTNAAYRITQVNQNFTVSGPSYNMVLYIDVAQIFNNTSTSESLNLVTESSSMSSSLDNPAVLPIFADNFSHAFTFTAP